MCRSLHCSGVSLRAGLLHYFSSNHKTEPHIFRHSENNNLWKSPCTLRPRKPLREIHPSMLPSFRATCTGLNSTKEAQSSRNLVRDEGSVVNTLYSWAACRRAVSHTALIPLPQGTEGFQKLKIVYLKIASDPWVDPSPNFVGPRF